MEFPVSSADCRVLLLLENTGSLRDVAKALGRDVSVVSRQISRIAESAPLGAPLVEKIDGKWQVSALGKQFTAWARDSILVQKRLLRSQTLIRIATTREFATRILVPALEEIRAGEDNVIFEVISASAGVEDLLLRGEVDIGLDCGAPRDPSVKFRRLARETFSIIASPRFLRHHPIRCFSELLKTPHVQVQARLSAARLLQLETDSLNPSAFFHDIAAARAACLGGLGWALLPTYSVREELDSGKLVELRGKSFPRVEPESFGVWWLRGRRGLESWIPRFASWLQKQKLS